MIPVRCRQYDLKGPYRTEYMLMTRLLSQIFCGRGLFFYAFPQIRKERYYE